MIGLILTIIIGFGIAIISRNNTAGINMTIGDNTYFNIPLYVLTVGTYLLGIMLAWIIEVPQEIGTALQIIGLGRKIKSGNNTIAHLQNKIKKLESENSKLHGRNENIVANRKTDVNYGQNSIRNFLHKISLR